MTASQPGARIGLDEISAVETARGLAGWRSSDADTGWSAPQDSGVEPPWSAEVRGSANQWHGHPDRNWSILLAAASERTRPRRLRLHIPAVHRGEVSSCVTDSVPFPLAPPGVSDPNALARGQRGAQLTAESLEESAPCPAVRRIASASTSFKPYLDCVSPRTGPGIETHTHARLIRRERSRSNFKPRLLACDYELDRRGFLTLAGSMPTPFASRSSEERLDQIRLHQTTRKNKGAPARIAAPPPWFAEMGPSLFLLQSWIATGGASEDRQTMRSIWFLTAPMPRARRRATSRWCATTVADPTEYLVEVKRTHRRNRPWNRSMPWIGVRAAAMPKEDYKPLDLVIQEFNSPGGRNRSLYGLFNAITATATRSTAAASASTWLQGGQVAAASVLQTDRTKTTLSQPQYPQAGHAEHHAPGRDRTPKRPFYQSVGFSTGSSLSWRD